MAAAADAVEADTHECNSNHSSCTECNDTRTEYNGSYKDEQPPVGRRCKRCNRWYLERYMCLPHLTCVRSSCQSVRSTLTTTVLMASLEVDSRRATRSEATEQHRGRSGPRTTNARAVAFLTPIVLSCAALMLQEGARCYLAVLLLLSSNSITDSRLRYVVRLPSSTLCSDIARDLPHKSTTREAVDSSSQQAELSSKSSTGGSASTHARCRIPHVVAVIVDSRQNIFSTMNFF